MRWALSLALAVCAGCAPLWDRVTQPAPVAAPAPDPVAELLSLLHGFLAADAERRSDIYLDTVSALARQPSPERRLRLALLQGWPGHRHSRPADALRLTDQVMDDASLDDGTRELARVLRFWIASHQVEQRRRRELQGRISELESQIEALRRQLTELTEIERVIEPVR